ncbi:MAG: hypothetical protein K6G61_10730 [Solobacterium sp.]|nr:hypothetical protein [Solobacterium sp.]
MIVKNAVRSLRNDFTRAFFYWLTFVLTSMFMFLFFNISMSDSVGVTFINSRTDLATTLTVCVIIAASIDIFFANDFFIKNKAKDLAVQLVCGATYIQLASYLLTQTFILLALAIPVGITLALLLLPLMNLFMTYYLHTTAVISVSAGAIGSTVFVLVFVIFWTTILNLSFAYRNSIAMLINGSNISIDLEMPYMGMKPLFSKRTKKIIWLCLFLVPVILYYFNSESFMMLSMFSLVGLNGCFKSIVLPYLDRRINDIRLDDAESIVYLGFLRRDVKVLKKNIIMLFILAILLLATMVNLEDPLEIMLVLLSYAVMNIMQSLSVVFTYATETSARYRKYLALSQIGFREDDLRKVIRSEASLLYGSLLCIGLFYLLNIFIALKTSVFTQPLIITLLTTLFAVPVILCFAVSLVYYIKAMSPAWTDEWN